MKPIRRELLNGLFVLVLASLIHAAFEAFHLTFDVHLWALIVMGVAIAVGGYVVLEFVLSADEREKEWLKRVGTPALLDLNASGNGLSAGVNAAVRAVKAMSPGNDLTLMVYMGGGEEIIIPREAIDELFSTIMERVRRGTIREYKRILCFDHDAFGSDHELKLGILRVGEGPGTIHRVMGQHC